MVDIKQVTLPPQRNMYVATGGKPFDSGSYINHLVIRNPTTARLILTANLITRSDKALPHTPSLFRCAHHAHHENYNHWSSGIFPIAFSLPCPRCVHC